MPEEPLIVGDTFAQNACNHNYTNKLSILTDCYFYANFIRTVEKSAFSPPPRTASAVISIQPKPKSDLLKYPALYIMRELFEQRDKIIKNALREALINYYKARGMVLTKKESIALLSDTISKIRSEIMLEQLQNAELVQIYNSLENMFKNGG